MKKWIVTLIVLALPLVAYDAPKPALAGVEKIYVGSMGQADEAERFRLLLEQELNRVGFRVVGRAEDADAILSGVLTVRVYADTSRARATVVLKSPDGEVLWSGDFEPRFSFRAPSDTVKFRAQNIAKKLQKDRHRASRAGNKRTTR